MRGKSKYDVCIVAVVVKISACRHHMAHVPKPNQPEREEDAGVFARPSCPIFTTVGSHAAQELKKGLELDVDAKATAKEHHRAKPSREFLEERGFKDCARLAKGARIAEGIPLSASVLGDTQARMCEGGRRVF